MSEDFYEVLGVSRDADTEEITQAYRDKATEYHPDVSDHPDAEEKFKKIQKAKEVLTDDEKRQMYDQVGHDQFVEAEKRGGGPGGPGGPGPGGAGGAGGMGGMGGAGGMGGIEDIFNEFFGGGRGGSRQGDDLVTRMRIDLADAYRGVEREVTLDRPEACDECDGTGHPPDASERTCPECGGQGQQTTVQQTPLGRVQQTRTCGRCEGDGRLYDEQCAVCDGDGQVRREATLSVSLPAGIADGQTLRIEGEGAAGEGGARPGDLLVEVRVDDHPDFERDGADLHHDLVVSFPQAVFGDSVTVPTVTGNAEFEVPPGTQSGRTFRLEGKGMPELDRRHRNTFGDLYVHVRVYVPESLNDDQTEALEQFAEAGGEDVEPPQSFFDRLKRSL